MGDILYTKIKTTSAGTMTILSGQVSIVGATLQLNDQGAIRTTFGASAQEAAITEWFLRYRLHGLKVKITYWPTGAAPNPIMGFIMAAADNVFPAPSATSTPEQRFASYKVLRRADSGAMPTTISRYLRVDLIGGADRSVSYDQSQTGIIQDATPPFFGTPVGPSPFWQHGLYTMTGAAVSANFTVDYKIELTSYLKCFKKRQLV